MIFRFEAYSLDGDRRELRCADDRVLVEPQVFDILLYLIRNRERVVGKDELLASVWNGRVVSESTFTSRISALRRAIGDSGQQQRLIRTVSRKGFRFVGDVWEERDPNVANALPRARRSEIEVSSQGPLRVPNPSVISDKPSIAVLPFANFSSDPDQSLSAAIREDLVTALSQFRWLSVIARNCDFPFKGKAVTARTAQEQSVRYLLEGSVRKSANRVRITARLIDAVTAAHLWANHVDGELDDIFDLQDQVTADLIGAIVPTLERVEINRAKRIPNESLDPYHCYLRGMGSVYEWTRDGISRGLSLFHKAIEIDPEFAPAYGMAAYCYVQRTSYGWIADRPQEMAECAWLARQAAELGSDDAGALAKAAHAIAYTEDIDSGAVFIEQALRLNPNLAAGWYVSGWIRLFLGEPSTGIEHLARAMRLSPFDQLLVKIRAGVAYAHFLAGRYDDASLAAEKALRARPHYLTAMRGAAASHALAGRLSEARKLIERMRHSDPALHISNLANLIPFRRANDFDRWAVGLQRAGLPD